MVAFVGVPVPRNWDEGSRERLLVLADRDRRGLGHPAGGVPRSFLGPCWGRLDCTLQMDLVLISDLSGLLIFILSNFLSFFFFFILFLHSYPCWSDVGF